jgi:hypothetical protein
VIRLATLDGARELAEHLLARREQRTVGAREGGGDGEQDGATEFIVWSEKPAGTWLPLPRFFARMLSSRLDGLWLQSAGCCSKASWVGVEVTVIGSASLTRSWQTFARARGLRERCTLHFQYDGIATLHMRMFGEDGERTGCCPEESSDDDELGLDDVRATSSGDGSSSGKSAGGGTPCRRALVKWEEGSN